MAKCERRAVTPKPPPVEYVLTLTAEEANYLASLLYRAVSGDGPWDEILRALRNAGTHTTEYRFDAIAVGTHHK